MEVMLISASKLPGHSHQSEKLRRVERARQSAEPSYTMSKLECQAEGEKRPWSERRVEGGVSVARGKSQTLLGSHCNCPREEKEGLDLMQPSAGQFPRLLGQRLRRACLLKVGHGGTYL